MKNPYLTEVYACRIKDEEALLASSSGGFFTVISDYYLENGDIVVCSVYNYKTNQQEFAVIKDKAERDKARGSKYVQSFIGDVFCETEDYLKQNPEKRALFIGTGCQAAGFIKYAESKGFRNRLMVVDLICYGLSSPLIWKDYVLAMEEKYGEIKYINFRDKRRGWKHPTPIAVFGDSEVSLREYRKVYSRRMAVRPCCYECPYARIKRNTDLSIGDYWGIDKKKPDFYDERGNSLVLIHSANGKELFDAIKPNIEWVQSNTEECIQIALAGGKKQIKGRERFWKDYFKHGVLYVIKKYGNDSLTIKVRKTIKQRQLFRVVLQRVVSKLKR